MQAILSRLGDYEVTREYYFESVASGQTYRVYDESDTVMKSGTSLFSFMEVGQTYDVKLFMMAEQTDKVETTFTYADDYTPGEETFARMINEFGDEFFVEFGDIEGVKQGDTVKLDSQRLDLMQVDDVIFGDYK